MCFENKVKRANQPMYKPIFVVEKKLKLALQIFAAGRPEKLQTLRVCNFIWRPSAKIRKAASAFFADDFRLSIGIFCLDCLILSQLPLTNGTCAT